MRISINWARANKLGLHDVSLRQKSVQLLGDISVLAVSNTLTLLGSPINRFFGLQQKKMVRFHAHLGQLIVTQACQLLDDVYRHPETSTNCSSHKG